MTANSSSLNIIFAGTPGFAAISLQALINSSHTVCAVYTQPDRPSGRGQKLTASPVKELALQHHLPLYQPPSLRLAHEQQQLATLSADLMVVVAYGLILPLAVLQIPRLGCINIHASLLPRWRGAAPIQRAILAGDTVTGITVMQMEEGLDTGPMLAKKECGIFPTDTSQTLHDRLAQLGAEILIATLDQFASCTAIIQDSQQATYAHKISKEEALLNWQESAEELDRKIRAFNPYPIAYTLGGAEKNRIRIWQAEVIPHTKPTLPDQPGTIIHTSRQGIDVVTGKHLLRIVKLQLPGGRVLSVADVLNAPPAFLTVGNLLG